MEQNRAALPRTGGTRIERCYWRLIARLVSEKPAPCGRAIGSVWNSEREPYGELHTTWITLQRGDAPESRVRDRKSTRLNSSHVAISYAVFCLKKKTEGAEGRR